MVAGFLAAVDVRQRQAPHVPAQRAQVVRQLLAKAAEAAQAGRPHAALRAPPAAGRADCSDASAGSRDRAPAASRAGCSSGVWMGSVTAGPVRNTASMARPQPGRCASSTLVRMAAKVPPKSRRCHRCSRRFSAPKKKWLSSVSTPRSGRPVEPDVWYSISCPWSAGTARLCSSSPSACTSARRSSGSCVPRAGQRLGIVQRQAGQALGVGRHGVAGVAQQRGELAIARLGQPRAPTTIRFARAGNARPAGWRRRCPAAPANAGR